MFGKKFYYIAAEAAPTFQDQIAACIVALESHWSKSASQKEHVLKQTIFLNAVNNTDFFARKYLLTSQLRKYYGPSYPPTSIVGQPPAGGETFVVELMMPDETVCPFEVLRKKIPWEALKGVSGDCVAWHCVPWDCVSTDCVPWHRVPGKDDGLEYTVLQYKRCKEVYGAGLTSGDLFSQSRSRAQAAFAQMQAVLKQEDLHFGHIVRQWNYIEDIVSLSGSEGKQSQTYQVFNDIRSIFYGTSQFPNGYPAATGIGMQYGGIVLDFIAVQAPEDVQILPVKNPEQIDAHHYSQAVLVGTPVKEREAKTTPKFERAKAVRCNIGSAVYISGTASIKGQQSVAVGDPEEQTRTTIENISRLIQAADTEKMHLNHCRVYLKHKEHLPLIKTICDRHYPGVPMVYLVSDVCRRELLVELEGAI